MFAGSVKAGHDNIANMIGVLYICLSSRAKRDLERWPIGPAVLVTVQTDLS